MVCKRILLTGLVGTASADRVLSMKIRNKKLNNDIWRKMPILALLSIEYKICESVDRSIISAAETKTRKLNFMGYICKLIGIILQLSSVTGPSSRRADMYNIIKPSRFWRGSWISFMQNCSITQFFYFIILESYVYVRKGIDVCYLWLLSFFFNSVVIYINVAIHFYFSSLLLFAVIARSLHLLFCSYAILIIFFFLLYPYIKFLNMYYFFIFKN